MFAVCAVALLCLVSVSHSAPLACEDVARPLDQLDPLHLAGRWALVAGGMTDAAYLEKFKTRDSAAINYPNASETPITSFTRSFNFNDSCQHLQSNITLEGSGFIFHQYNITVTFLYTSCPDCLLMRFDDESKKPLRMYLFSRRRELEQKEIEEFSAQAKCLNMLPPASDMYSPERCTGVMHDQLN
uniref:Uncharacterized protein n=1 Tax=Seriola lalandi dorsalis TaxID=1841481 RepID=A0A3B4Y0M9_SERLL